MGESRAGSGAFASSPSCLRACRHLLRAHCNHLKSLRRRMMARASTTVELRWWRGES